MGSQCSLLLGRHTCKKSKQTVDDTKYKHIMEKLCMFCQNQRFLRFFFEWSSNPDWEPMEFKEKKFFHKTLILLFQYFFNFSSPYSVHVVCECSLCLWNISSLTNRCMFKYWWNSFFKAIYNNVWDTFQIKGPIVYFIEGKSLSRHEWEV